MTMAGSFSDARPTDLDALLASAARLWTYSDEIYAATKYPFVDRHVIKNASSFAEIFVHVYDAGRASTEAKLARKLARLHRKIARLRAEIRVRGGDPDALEFGAQLEALPPPEPIVNTRADDVSCGADPDAFPLLRNWANAIFDYSKLTAMLFECLDREVADPPEAWPEVIRQPVKRFTGLELVNAASAIVHRHIPTPRGETVEEYLSRFTRRVVRLGPEYSNDVALAITQSRWLGAANPIAYVHQVAVREHLKVEGRLSGQRSRDVYARQEAPWSLDREIQVTGTPLEAFISSMADQFAEVESRLMVEAAIVRAGLSPLARLALEARESGVSRRDAPSVYGISPSQIEAGFKALQRARSKLRNSLSA